jgi:hypothetical protein
MYVSNRTYHRCSELVAYPSVTWGDVNAEIMLKYCSTQSIGFHGKNVQSVNLNVVYIFYI